MTLPVFSYLAPPVVFGMNSAQGIADHIQRLGGTHALLVSDSGLAKIGLVDQLAGWMRQGPVPVTVYSAVEPEPSLDSVRTCLAFARQAGVDLVVGLGGGSAMDTAKVVAALLGNPGDIAGYLGLNKIPRKGVPTILVPTTAGTGSEIGRGALFYVPERRSKEAVFSAHMLTDLALIDPALMASAPASVTAASGIDALCHAIESYTSRAAHPLSMPFAELGVRWISRHLAAAVADGADLEARQGMALGSLYASIALANANTHAVHALAYPLQGRNRIIHGRANGVLLPYVLRAISGAVGERLAHVTGWMGLQASEADAGEVLAEALLALSRQIGIQTHMSELGVEEAQLDGFAQEAFAIRRLLDNCPASLDLAQIRAIYQNAL